MTLLQSGLAKSLAADAYTIDNSMRMEASSDPYLTRTPGSDGNRRTWTFSGWYKVSNKVVTGSEAFLWSAYDGSGGYHDYIRFGDMNAGTMKWTIAASGNGSIEGALVPTQVFRDPGAWYHMVFAFDSTAAATDRMRWYVNGEEITSFSTDTNPSLNFQCENVNTQCVHRVSASAYDPTSGALDGYTAEVYFIDGSQLDADDFGERDSDTNQWIPLDSDTVKAAVTFGTNGFYLDFADSADLGDDDSGEGNDYTETNLVATDQMIDTPTNNWCTLNPLQTSRTSGVTLSEGNLKLTSDDYYKGAISTIAVNSGKWYWELCDVATDTFMTGFTTIKDFKTVTGLDYRQGQYIYKQSAVTSVNGYGTLSVSGGSNTMAAGSTGDIYHFALDLDNGRFYIGVNGTWTNSSNPATGTNYFYGDWYTAGNYYSPFTTNGPSSNQIYNFGQDSSFAGNKTSGSAAAQDSNEIGDFYYAPPTDYLALCTDNLSDPEIKLPGDYFNTVIWSGTGGARDFTGVGFQPDFLWGKARDDTWEHLLIDSVRGSNETLYSNSSNEESTDDSHGYVDSLDADGWSVVAGSSSANQWNDSTDTFVAWNWKAGGAPTADNSAGAGAVPTAGSVKIDGANLGSALAGTIAAKRMTANTTSGFSIIEYDGNTTSGATVPHGLGVAPDMVILKQRGATGTQWYVGSNRTDGWDAPVILNLTGAGYDDVNYFHDTVPSSSVVTLGSYSDVNGTGMMAYCFASIEGYSKVGIWVATGSDPGPFFYCGFKPAFVMVKNVSSGSSNWWIMDNKRSTYNMDAKVLFPNSGQIEASGRSECDFLSNGVKFRGVVNPESNYSTNTYLIYAVAENPFKFSNAR